MLTVRYKVLVDSSDKLEQKLILRETAFSSGSFSPLVSHEKILFPTRLPKPIQILPIFQSVSPQGSFLTPLYISPSPIWH